MTYIRPIDQHDVDAAEFITWWLWRNGCRHYVANKPIIVRGNIIEYYALARFDRKSVLRFVRSVRRVPQPKLKRIRQRFQLHPGMVKRA